MNVYDTTLPYPRDLVGYGRNPPHAQWPGQARIAVQFVLNYEEGGENAVLHGDAGSEQFLSEMFNPASYPDRHLSMEGIYEYGSRVGVWRILREFEKRGLPLTVFGVGMALERGVIDAGDALLMNSPLGLAGQKCLANLVFACGSPIAAERVERALEAAREVIEGHPLKLQAGITCAHPQVIVLRVMSPLVEPTMDLLKQVWATWRHTLWNLPSVPPRIWSV